MGSGQRGASKPEGSEGRHCLEKGTRTIGVVQVGDTVRPLGLDKVVPEFARGVKEEKGWLLLLRRRIRLGLFLALAIACSLSSFVAV
jgi:hypothetical protein